MSKTTPDSQPPHTPTQDSKLSNDAPHAVAGAGENQPHSDGGGKKAAPRRLGRGLSALMTPKPVAVSSPKAVSVEQSAPPSSPEVDGAGPRDAPATQEASTDPVLDEASAVEQLRMIRLDVIRPNRHQPRTQFDDSLLEELAASIRSHGVLQPITVRAASVGGYELIAGERRWRAARLAGLERIPCLLKDLTDSESSEIALIENVQREDLDPVDRSDALCALASGFGLSQEQIAERIGLERSTVANLMRLKELPGRVRELMRGGGLGVGHGKALLGAEPGARTELAERAAAEGWSVRVLEREARASKAKGAATAEQQEAMRGASAGESGAEEVSAARALVDDLEKSLSEQLGTRVEIRPGRDRTSGRVVVHFYDLDQFDGLLQRMGYVAS